MNLFLLTSLQTIILHHLPYPNRVSNDATHFWVQILIWCVNTYIVIEMKSTHVRITDEALARLKAMKLTENETDAEALDRITKSLQEKALDQAELEGKLRWSK